MEVEDYSTNVLSVPGSHPRYQIAFSCPVYFVSPFSNNLPVFPGFSLLGSFAEYF